jgi:hypothetical protein
LNQYSEVRFIVLDADDDSGFTDLVQLNQEMATEYIPSYLELSRRGGHLWMFFDKQVSGHQARKFGRGLLTAYRIEGLELFPKQGNLGEGPGSLIRMPFGLHRLSGRRYGFIAPDGEPLAPTMQVQIYALTAPQVVPEVAFEAYKTCAPSMPKTDYYMRSEEVTGALSERIKSSITVLELVSQYVDIKPSGSGGIGRCPFHDDHKPSFGVNDEGNYWHCFAGCGGGSVIDFWMKWRECDFTTAVTELARMVLPQ